MKNAKKFNSRITIGGVPDSEDLTQLKDLGFKTLIDLRDTDERFGGRTEERARELGLNFTSISVDRETISTEHLLQFYRAALNKESEPLYCFSRFGKRPLAFLLLLETLHQRQPIAVLFQRAARFGLNLEGDLALHAFLVQLFNTRESEKILQAAKELRPDLY